MSKWMYMGSVSQSPEVPFNLIKFGYFCLKSKVKTRNPFKFDFIPTFTDPAAISNLFLPLFLLRNRFIHSTSFKKYAFYKPKNKKIPKSINLNRTWNAIVNVQFTHILGHKVMNNEEPFRIDVAIIPREMEAIDAVIVFQATSNKFRFLKAEIVVG